MSPEIWEANLTHGLVRFVDEGHGPVLLLIHGLGGNWQNWQANIAGLARCHRVVAPDLPGFGSSPPYRGAVTMTRYADTIVEFLDVLDIESAIVVGNSMGGLLAIEIAVRHPGRVRGIVLACSAGIPLTTLRHRIILRPSVVALNAVLRGHRIRRAALASPAVRGAIAARIVHRPRQIDPEHLGAALDGLGTASLAPVLRAGLRYDARRQAPKVSCPTLIVWGRHDRLLPVWMGRQLHRMIAHSELVVWDDSAHCPMIEQPQRFNALVDAFARSGLRRPVTDKLEGIQ